MVREDASVPSPLAVRPLVDLAFSAQLTSDEELDFADFTTQHFQSATAERYPIAHPLLKAFLVVLASAHPDQLAYATAVSRALPLAREYGYRGEADEDFLDALLDTIQLHAVKLHTHARAFGGGIEHHRPSRLARLQAQNPQWPVTTRSHQALDLDEWGRWLLVQTGEGLGEVELTGKLAARLESAGVKFEIAQAQKLVHDYLTLFQQHGLLV